MKLLKKGVIDQTITSIIVLFAAAFLSGVFVIISSNVANVLGSDGNSAEFSSLSQSGSSVMADLFLTDVIEINGEFVLVKDYLIGLVERINNERQIPYDELSSNLLEVENIFDKSYSCGGINEMHLVFVPLNTGVGPSLGHAVYLDYPNYKWSKNIGLPRYVNEHSSNEFDKFLYDIYTNEGLASSKGYSIFYLSPNAQLIIKENLKC